MFFTYSAHQSRTPVSLMWNIWWNSAGKRMLRYSQLFNQCRFWFWDYPYTPYVVIEQPICYCSVVRLYLSLGFPSFEPLTMLYTSCIHFLSCDCWIACPCMLCLSPVTLIICVGGDILFHFEFCIYCSEFVQECTEFANLAREHVTNIDSKIQAYGGWILILVLTKWGHVAACTCKPAFVVPSDTDEQPIVVSILISNNLRTIAPNCELLIHLCHSSELIQWKTDLSACLQYSRYSHSKQLTTSTSCFISLARPANWSSLAISGNSNWYTNC